MVEKLDENTKELWKLLYGDFAEQVLHISNKKDVQNYREVRSQLDEIRLYAKRSPHFKDSMRIEPAEEDGLFVMQLKDYIQKNEINKSAEELIKETSEEINNAIDTMNEANETVDELNDLGLL